MPRYRGTHCASAKPGFLFFCFKEKNHKNLVPDAKRGDCFAAQKTFRNRLIDLCTANIRTRNAYLRQTHSCEKQEIGYNNIRRWERGFRIFPPLQFFVFSCLLYLFVLNFARCFGKNFEKYSCNLKFLLFYLLILKVGGAKTPVTFCFPAYLENFFDKSLSVCYNNFTLSWFAD